MFRLFLELVSECLLSYCSGSTDGGGVESDARAADCLNEQLRVECEEAVQGDAHLSGWNSRVGDESFPRGSEQHREG